MKKKKKIIFFGDSLTQYGVLTGGYIDLLNKKLEDNNRQGNYELLGSGIVGNKITDLYYRLEEDVLKKKPDVVVIWIGVNDVWLKSTVSKGAESEEFEKLYSEIIRRLQAEHIKIILVTPAVIGEQYDNSGQKDDELNLYSAIIHKLAKQYGCTVCDIRTAFINYEKIHNKANLVYGILTTDGVHLNLYGNQLVADIMYSLLADK
ncbi:MAG: G-D-S-L family lipolytic protein [Sphingobacteriales bacterium]|nr:MAG: G-D-S-L family lipolytic protein [Sphingobacteriales bacterium]